VPRHCVARARLLVPAAMLPHSPLFLSHPATNHQAPPLSPINATASPPAPDGRGLLPAASFAPRCRPSCLGPPLSPISFPPRGTKPTPPFPSLVLPRMPADLEKPLTPHSALFCVHARARAPLLLHHLRACLVGSHHQRPHLLSSSCPSTAAIHHYW
jgi:hypothetical protein